MSDSRLDPGRPRDDECLPYYFEYIRLVPDGPVVDRLDAAAWARRAPAEWTLRSVRAIAYAMAGHELHHAADIRRQHGL